MPVVRMLLVTTILRKDKGSSLAYVLCGVRLPG